MGTSSLALENLLFMPFTTAPQSVSNKYVSNEKRQSPILEEFVWKGEISTSYYHYNIFSQINFRNDLHLHSRPVFSICNLDSESSLVALSLGGPSGIVSVIFSSFKSDPQILFECCFNSQVTALEFKQPHDFHIEGMELLIGCLNGTVYGMEEIMILNSTSQTFFSDINFPSSSTTSSSNSLLYSFAKSNTTQSITNSILSENEFPLKSDAAWGIYKYISDLNRFNTWRVTKYLPSRENENSLNSGKSLGIFEIFDSKYVPQLNSMLTFSLADTINASTNFPSLPFTGLFHAFWRLISFIFPGQDRNFLIMKTNEALEFHKSINYENSFIEKEDFFSTFILDTEYPYEISPPIKLFQDKSHKLKRLFIDNTKRHAHLLSLPHNPFRSYPVVHLLPSYSISVLRFCPLQTNLFLIGRAGGTIFEFSKRFGPASHSGLQLIDPVTNDSSKDILKEDESNFHKSIFFSMSNTIDSNSEKILNNFNEYTELSTADSLEKIQEEIFDERKLSPSFRPSYDHLNCQFSEMDIQNSNFLSNLSCSSDRIQDNSIISSSLIYKPERVGYKEPLKLQNENEKKILKLNKLSDISPNNLYFEDKPANSKDSQRLFNYYKTSPSLLEGLILNLESSESKIKSLTNIFVNDPIRFKVLRTGLSSNPIGRWESTVSIQPSKGLLPSLTNILFSPNNKFFAASFGQGIVKIFSYPDGLVKLIIKTFYGPVLCTSWSHDSRLLYIGGEDDCITIIDVYLSRLVGRCEGHKAWVKGILSLNQNDNLISYHADAFETNSKKDFTIANDIRADNFQNKENIPPFPSYNRDPILHNRTSFYGFASISADGVLAYWEISLEDEHEQASFGVSSQLTHFLVDYNQSSSGYKYQDLFKRVPSSQNNDNFNNFHKLSSLYSPPFKSPQKRPVLITLKDYIDCQVFKPCIYRRPFSSPIYSINLFHPSFKSQTSISAPNLNSYASGTSFLSILSQSTQLIIWKRMNSL